MAGAVTSIVQIMNSALVKLGAELIVSPTDNNTRARICNEQYPKIRDEVLSSHPWRFAMARSTLSASVTPPVFGYANQFPLPADCLRPISIDTNGQNDIPWEREGSMLLTDNTTVSLRYIKAITDVTLFDNLFCEVLALRLASDICFQVTQNATLATALSKAYADKLREARSYSAQQSAMLDQVTAPSWLTSRY